MTHDVQHAKDVIANNPDVPLAVLLDHPSKKWTPEAKEYFLSLIEPAKGAGAPSEANVATAVMIEEATPDIALIQPDAEGKFPTPLDGALFMASLGIPQTPLRSRTKEAFLPGFQQSATANFVQIRKWAELYPDCNWGSVGREGEYFTFESDSTEVRKRFEATGGTFTSKLVIMSRPGRGHRWYRSTPQVTNIQQSFTKHGDLSVRAKNMYCVSPGSVHPDTGEQYRLISAGAPDVPSAAEIAFWESERAEKKDGGKAEIPRSERGLVPHGSIHGYMLREAGKLRQMGLGHNAIETALLQLVHDNCEPPIDDKKVEQMAKSICNFPAGEGDKSLALTQQPSASVAPVTVNALPTFKPKTYPVFPSWVMRGTSIYEAFVKPYCEKNSRVDYFMWAPTAAMFLNYLGTKVRVAWKGWKPSFYLVLIGEKDRAHKSSSIKDGMKYLEFAGFLSMYWKEIKNADGKALVWEAGSPEGLGTDMQRTNCKNSILFYDELSTLVSKSQIEGSGMMGALLKMYESNNFSNSVKKKQEAFSVAPDSYVATVITATTDQRFHELWGQFAGDDTGLNTRFTFILQPQQLPEEELEEVVPFFEACEKTKARASAAINQGVFEFDYGFDGKELLKECQKMCGGRAEIRAEKWALYFAIDLGKTVIDSECIERGVALANYEREVKKYLATEEAATKSAGLQQKMVQLLERNNGRVPEHGEEGFRALTGERKYGTDMWRKAFFGLVNENVLKQENGDVVMVRSWGGSRE